MALDMDDIKIMRDSGVKIAFPHERKAHAISSSTKPSDLLKVNYIRLNGQYLSKIPAWLPKMTNLVKLELEDTNIDLKDLFALKPLINLNTLNLSNNKNLFNKGGKLSELLSHFSLSELYLSNTGGSSSDYANIGENISLIKLDLSDNSISSIESLHLEKLKNLKRLTLENNSISGTLDTAYLPKESLVYLNLSSNDISRLKFSSDFPTLKSLYIAKNRSYLEFDEEWNDVYILKQLSEGIFNEDVVLPKSIMKRLGIKSKWITPSSSVCRANGGKVESDGCKANWENAKKICSVMGRRLPNINELKKVVTDCGGTSGTINLHNDNWGNIGNKNKNNKSYQSCYKGKEFSSEVSYWSKSYNNNDIYTIIISSGLICSVPFSSYDINFIDQISLTSEEKKKIKKKDNINYIYCINK